MYFFKWSHFQMCSNEFNEQSSVKCILLRALCTVLNQKCAGYIVHSSHYTVNRTQYRLYTIQFTVYKVLIVQWTVSSSLYNMCYSHVTISRDKKWGVADLVKRHTQPGNGFLKRTESFDLNFCTFILAEMSLYSLKTSYPLIWLSGPIILF